MLVSVVVTYSVTAFGQALRVRVDVIAAAGAELAAVPAWPAID